MRMVMQHAGRIGVVEGRARRTCHVGGDNELTEHGPCCTAPYVRRVDEQAGSPICQDGVGVALASLYKVRVVSFLIMGRAA